MYSLELAKTEMYDVVLKLMSFSESYTAMYSYVPCMVYEYPFSCIKVYTFLNLYIEVHTGINFRGKVYTGIYLYIRFRSDLYHSMEQVPLKSYNQVYRRIYFDIPYFGQVAGIPDGSSCRQLAASQAVELRHRRGTVAPLRVSHSTRNPGLSPGPQAHLHLES
jgi:hypothetical protein